MDTIDRHQLLHALAGAEPPALVEALGPAAYDQGHLPGAVRLQLQEMSAGYVRELLPDPHAQVVTYCSSPTCRASHGVAAKLTALGYTDVAVYTGGKLDWIESGQQLIATVGPQGA